MEQDIAMTYMSENIAWNSGFNETPSGVVTRWAKEKIYFVYNKFPDCCSSTCTILDYMERYKRVGCAFCSMWKGTSMDMSI